MASPAVVGARAVGHVGAAEVGGGEGGHRVGDVQLVHRRVEGGQGAVELGEEVGLGAVERGGADLPAVRVVPLGGAEEDLPAQAQRFAYGDELRDHLELGGEVGVWKLGGE